LQSGASALYLAPSEPKRLKEPPHVRRHKDQKKLSAAELMDEMNVDVAKLHAWIRTQANAPAQRPWFADTSEARASSPRAALPPIR
jgi:hypothetical protein